MNHSHKYQLSLLALLIITGIFFSCDSYQASPMDLSRHKIIPVPVSVVSTGSSFRITANTTINVASEDEEVISVAGFLRDILRPATGFELPVSINKAAGKRSINLNLIDEEELGNEGYLLYIAEKNIRLEANTAEGLFRGIQSIRQLLPALIERDSVQDVVWEIASGSIRDYPVYEYRSAMLDVSRHFFGPENIREVIDWLVRYKMNNLHLHLSDDQGWRIEIEKWPELTKTGGSSQVGGGKGGYLSKDEFKALVQYATERYINIVPEIDMPGHTNAALASYSFLNCNDKSPDLYTGTEVGFSTLCTERDSVYFFIDDVIGEITEMIPGPYFHIGGDESHVTKKEDYIYFVQKVQEIVTRHGKQMIGWDEIAQIKLREDALVQVWNSEENAVIAVRQGSKVILSPANRCYLDMKYDSTTTLGLSWAGLIEVDHGYDWYPEQLIQEVKKEHILGIECPLWTETVTNMDEMEFLVFPRLPGYAEIGWSQKENRSWETYKQRLAGQTAVFEEMGLDFYRSKLISWEK